ncbi:MAG: hypothetical protein F6K56_40805 [Moorea sp. SIO3G5]|nr:hypothetical protein [Moorena sp. SIO3G5]
MAEYWDFLPLALNSNMIIDLDLDLRSRYAKGHATRTNLDLFRYTFILT